VVVWKDNDESRQAKSVGWPRLALGRDRTGNLGQAAEARDLGARLSGQEPVDCPLERRPDDAAVGDEARDEARRKDVKRWFEDGCSLW